MTFGVSDLLDLAGREHDLAQERIQSSRDLPIGDLVDRGDAILGLTLTSVNGREAAATCDVNFSRIRSGDSVELRSSSRKCKARVIDVTGGGRTLYLQLSREIPRLVTGQWQARLLPMDTSDIAISALRKIQPGAPGWGFFNALATGDWPGIGSSDAAAPNDKESLLGKLSKESGHNLDHSQEEAFTACFRLPRAHAIQGPPGTGKTLLLAFVAEALALMGNRVLIIAPTHQAVNNALSTIRKTFRDRELLKVGDELRRESLDESISSEILPQHARKLSFLAKSQRITGMTFLSAVCHLVLRRSPLAPNVVLIDEAGQLPLTLGSCSGLFGAGSVLIFGDDMQMPPVFASGVKDSQLATSLFAAYRASGGCMTVLDRTYRLNDQLCTVIGQEFYPSADGSTRLRSSDCAASRRFTITVSSIRVSDVVRRALSPEPSLVWVRAGDSASSQSNPVEAQIAAEIVATSLESGLHPEDIAVVTPFRRQAAMIRNQLQDLLGGRYQMPLVDTVERLQGLTVEAIVLSL